MTRSDLLAATTIVFGTVAASLAWFMGTTSTVWMIVAVMCVLALPFGWRGIRARLLNSVSSIFSEQLRIASVESQNALRVFQRLPKSTPPVSTFSMCATNLALLLDLVEEKEPRLVIELGSGLSTLVIAETIRKFGGKIVSFEHEEKWVQRMCRHIDQNDLSEVAEVRLVSLKRRSMNGKTSWWYDESQLREFERSIDLLIVDGPPQSYGWDARRPAFDTFYPHFSPSVTIAIDDANRDGESAIVADWLKKDDRFKDHLFSSFTGMRFLTRDEYLVPSNSGNELSAVATSA